MQDNKSLIAQLSPHLFWDTNLETLDWQRNKRLIIERVLNRGTWEEWKLIVNRYGKQEMKTTLCELPYIEKKEANFVQVYFGIKPEEMKCYTNKRLTNHF